MKKLKLNLDEIKVESFETMGKKTKNHGTVLGQVSGGVITCSPCDSEDCTDNCVTVPSYTCGASDPCVYTCEQDCPEGYTLASCKVQC